MVGLGGCGTLETLSKALILSKSLNKRKLDSLAYSCAMRVFAYIVVSVTQINEFIMNMILKFQTQIESYTLAEVYNNNNVYFKSLS